MDTEDALSTTTEDIESLTAIVERLSAIEQWSGESVEGLAGRLGEGHAVTGRAQAAHTQAGIVGGILQSALPEFEDLKGKLEALDAD